MEEIMKTGIKGFIVGLLVMFAVTAVYTHKLGQNYRYCQKDTAELKKQFIDSENALRQMAGDLLQLPANVCVEIHAYYSGNRLNAFQRAGLQQKCLQYSQELLRNKGYEYIK
jgi:hypothetical protein